MAPRVELLSPAGDYESFEFALAYGADAVYLAAKQFGMRSACANFTAGEMEAAVRMAHSRGKKVYLTVNTLPTNSEVAALPGLLRQARGLGVDAFIVADLGVLRMAKQYAPQVEIHLSTQMGITNYAAASAAYELGAKRVVLARELSLEDIANIRKNTPGTLQLEVFVHGAMCMSVSGRCLLSSAMAGRDANRGSCAQPCRWKYSIVEEKRPGEYLEIGEDSAGSYILSADDLCAAPFLDKVIEAGATSLKIEGRAKTFNYVASVTAAYRAALDAALAAPRGGYTEPEFTRQELERISHRPYSSGFYFGRDGATQSPHQEGYIRRWQLVGVVYARQGRYAWCRQRGKFTLGEELEALIPGGQVVTFTPKALYGEDGGPIESTPHTKMLFAVPLPPGQDFPPQTILRRRMTQ